MLNITLVVLWFVLCLVVGYVAHNMGRSFGIYFAIAFFLSPLIGFIILAIKGKNINNEVFNEANQVKSTWTRSELKTKAKADFKANYWLCVLVAFILALLTSAASGAGSRANFNSTTSTDELSNIISDSVSDLESSLGIPRTDVYSIIAASVLIILIVAIIISIVMGLFNLLVGNALIVGCRRFFTQNAYSQDAALRDVGYVFSSGHWGNVTITMFLMHLYVALWSLLFIIPGIIKLYEYRMVPYILAENPSINHKEAFRISKELMSGQKFNTFVLDLSFILWGIASLIPLVGLFYVQPYINQTDAELYIKLKNINNILS